MDCEHSRLRCGITIKKREQRLDEPCTNQAHPRLVRRLAQRRDEQQQLWKQQRGAGRRRRRLVVRVALVRSAIGHSVRGRPRRLHNLGGPRPEKRVELGCDARGAQRHATRRPSLCIALERVEHRPMQSRRCQIGPTQLSKQRCLDTSLAQAPLEWGAVDAEGDQQCVERLRRRERRLAALGQHRH